MEKNSFFKTIEGGLTIAFLAIMAAFGIIMAGLNASNDVICMIGFLVIVAAMLYSPFKVYILDRRKK